MFTIQLHQNGNLRCSERRRFVITGCSGVVAALDGSGGSQHPVRHGTKTKSVLRQMLPRRTLKVYNALELDEQSHEVQDMGFHVVEPFREPERWLASLELGTKSW